ADLMRDPEIQEQGSTSFFDPMPDTSISNIISIEQAGGATYVKGTDFIRTGNMVEWLFDGNRPNSGESYTVTYTYMTQVDPENIDETGFTVNGADEGSNVLVDYQWKQPRIDLITLDKEGVIRRIKGISRPYFPRAPKKPEDQLSLAEIRQTWFNGEELKITNHAVHTISMSEL
ncbi:MAG: DUF4815 domain-containing protein, partial [bacterium]|nr:DUF4815 domain-containing protein [bacterium]